MIAGLSFNELAVLVVALVLAGALTGLLAGLFGIGGGGIMVPILFEIFRILEVPEDVRMPLCVGTSLAIIIPTSIRSLQAQLARDAVDKAVLKTWAVPTILGVLIGSTIASFAPSYVFKLVFAGFSLFMALRLIGNQTHWKLGETLPARRPMVAWGGGIGLISSLMGVGGGALSSTLMTLYNVPIHRALATSAGMGVLISIPGAVGYILAGWGKAGLPPFSLGFVSLIGVVLIAPLSIVTAPIGVAIAHGWSKRRLEVAFGVFMIIVAGRFIASLAGY